MYYYFDMNKFSDRLKELRLENKLTTKSLGQQIGVSNATISRWENGKNNIKVDELIAVAKFFHVSIDYLVGLED